MMNTWTGNPYWGGGPPTQQATSVYDWVNFSPNVTVVPGNVQVTLTPAGAISAGAQWNVDSGGWQSSGATVTGLSPGTHDVYFNSVPGVGLAGEHADHHHRRRDDVRHRDLYRNWPAA